MMSWMVTLGLWAPFPGAHGAQASESFLHRAFDELAQGVGEQPIPLVLTEGTCGVLEVGWNESALPILASDAGVFVAATTLGEGRVVAFAGQDFLSSDDESTFIGIPGNDALVRNAVRWASGPAHPDGVRVLVDNRALADLLADAGFGEVAVASILSRAPGDSPGLAQARAWTAAALSGVDVAVVLVNQWDVTHVGASEIDSLRAFVQAGGGLLVGGSSYHWDGDDPEAFPGNRLLAGAGVRWGGEEEPDLARARIAFGPRSSPVALWNAYLAGEALDATDVARLPAVFASVALLRRADELDRALARLVAETPDLPARAADPRARLSAQVASSLGPHPWPSAHPWAASFPGAPAASAKRVERTVAVDASWIGRRPLGLYAAPGEPVVLEFAERYTRLGWRVVVGDEHDDLRNGEHATWRRAPHLQRSFALDAARVTVCNAYGGPLYLLIPEARAERLRVTVRGAVPMALYTLGESRVDDWKRDLAHGAPQAMLQALGSVRFVVAAAAAAEVDDPERILEFWRGFHGSHAELAQEPTPRRFESHWIFDPQVGSGYANASPVVSSQNSGGRGIGRIVFPIEMTALALTTDSGEDDYWTVAHELGHQFQTDDWIGGDLTEVAVNLFALYTKNGYVHGGGEFETVSFEEDHYGHADLIDFRWDDVGEWEKLQLFRQLVLTFGWRAFQRTFASYTSSDYPRAEYGGHTDGFAIRFSAIVERDLTGFLEHWEYPLSQAAADKIRSFALEPWMPPGWSLPRAREGR